MNHLIIAVLVFLSVFVPIACTVAFIWRWHVTDERKRILDVIISSVQLAALLAGGYWFAVKFLLSERDTLGPRITVRKIEAESELTEVSGGNGCRVLFTWGATNNGPAAGIITHSDFLVREDMWKHDCAPPRSCKAPYVEHEEDGPSIISERVPGPESPLRPGSTTEFSRTVIFADSPTRYRVVAEVYVEGDPRPWTTSARVRCYTNPAPPSPDTTE